MSLNSQTRDVFISTRTRLEQEVHKNHGRIVFDQEGYIKFKIEQTTANQAPAVVQKVRPSNPPTRTGELRQRYNPDRDRGYRGRGRGGGRGGPGRGGPGRGFQQHGGRGGPGRYYDGPNREYQGGRQGGPGGQFEPRVATTIVNNLIITGMVLITVGEKEATETIVTAVVEMTGKAAIPASRMIATLETEARTASKITDRLLIIALVSIRRVTGPMATTIKIKDRTTRMAGIRNDNDGYSGPPAASRGGYRGGSSQHYGSDGGVLMDITDPVTKEVMIMDLPTRFQASRPKGTTELAAKIANARTTNINSQTRLLVDTIKDNINVKLATRTLS